MTAPHDEEEEGRAPSLSCLFRNSDDPGNRRRRRRRLSPFPRFFTPIHL